MLPIRSTERMPFDATVLRWAMLLNEGPVGNTGTSGIKTGPSTGQSFIHLTATLIGHTHTIYQHPCAPSPQPHASPHLAIRGIPTLACIWSCRKCAPPPSPLQPHALPHLAILGISMLGCIWSCRKCARSCMLGVERTGGSGGRLATSSTANLPARVRLMSSFKSMSFHICTLTKIRAIMRCQFQDECVPGRGKQDGSTCSTCSTAVQHLEAVECCARQPQALAGGLRGQPQPVQLRVGDEGGQHLKGSGRGRKESQSEVEAKEDSTWRGVGEEGSMKGKVRA